jgi:hypothetical protein
VPRRLYFKIVLGREPLKDLAERSKLMEVEEVSELHGDRYVESFS